MDRASGATAGPAGVPAPGRPAVCAPSDSASSRRTPPGIRRLLQLSAGAVYAASGSVLPRTDRHWNGCSTSPGRSPPGAPRAHSPRPGPAGRRGGPRRRDRLDCRAVRPGAGADLDAAAAAPADRSAGAGGPEPGRVPAARAHRPGGWCRGGRRGSTRRATCASRPGPGGLRVEFGGTDSVLDVDRSADSGRCCRSGCRNSGWRVPTTPGSRSTRRLLPARCAVSARRSRPATDGSPPGSAARSATYWPAVRCGSTPATTCLASRSGSRSAPAGTWSTSRPPSGSARSRSGSPRCPRRPAPSAPAARWP